MQTKLVLKQRSALKLRFQPGASGPAGTITVGTVTTGAPGTSVIVTNVGTPENAVLDFTIPEGEQGDIGDTGDKGWSPAFAIVSDGARRVLQVDDWVGGEGTKPATGDYVGASGLTPTIGDAVDIRGPAGTATIPDGDKGDITTSDSGDTWEINAGAVGATEIADEAVTNAKLAAMASGTLKGNDEAGSGPPKDLTGTEATALLDAFTGDSGSGGVKGLVPAPGAGEGATDFLSADGTFKNPIAAGTVINHRPAALATTSGTSKGFSLTGEVKRVRIILNGVSITTSDRLTVQIGTGGAAQTTGYVGSATLLPHAGAIAVANITNGAALTGAGGAALLWNGWVEFALQDATTNAWSWSGSFGVSGGATLAAGTVSLSGPLDVVRLTMDAGAGTFDAGAVSIEYDTTA